MELDTTERRILELLAQGYEGPAIATELGYALRTIKNRVAALEMKLGASTRAQLVHEAHRHGWLSVGTDDVAEYRSRLTAAERRNAVLEEELSQLRTRLSRAQRVLRGEA